MFFIRWKEECHSITQQSEAKFTEMKNNFDNIRVHNEKLVHDLQEMRIRDLEVGSFISRFFFLIFYFDF